LLRARARARRAPAAESRMPLGATRRAPRVSGRHRRRARGP
jgi:hypothetical protein